MHNKASHGDVYCIAASPSFRSRACWLALGFFPKMNIEMEVMPKYEKIQMALFGIILAAALFGYGFYSLITGTCTVIGRGFPVGTFVSFSGIEARLLSFIYTGAGLWLFSGFYLNKLQRKYKNNLLSWVGALSLLFGLLSLVVILCLPFLQQ